MEFDNSFEVAAPIETVWVLLNDIERIAPCMPGAEITEVIDESNFKGKVAVRLGPVALTFQGQASFIERDDSAYSATVKAQGSDSRGRGGANSLITFSMVPSDNGGTTVNIHTDLQLSGSVAQYGRGVGMVTDLASQLIGQFADCLHREIVERDAGDAAPITPAKPPEMTGLALRVMWNAIVRTIKRLFGGSG